MITDEQVDIAMKAYWGGYYDDYAKDRVFFVDMRRALEAVFEKEKKQTLLVYAKSNARDFLDSLSNEEIVRLISGYLDGLDK